MDRYRLKNIIIVILLLVNGFLLGVLSMRQTSVNASHRQTAEQLVELFAADGMALRAEDIPAKAAPAGQSLARDMDREREVAAFFLGKNPIRADQGGDIYSYTGSAGGAAQFRAGGSFDIACALSGVDGTGLIRDFCQEFSYSEPVFTLDGDGSGTAIAVCRYKKLTVPNCAVTFTLDQGALVAVSGILLPEKGTEVSFDQDPLSAAAALTAFQKMRRERQAAVSSVTEVAPCYELQSATSAAMSLVPAWCITTDTGRYYVNCISGAVSSD